MTREFPDELLSAFLDDELSPAERAQVEQQLAASEVDRQLLAELKSLRRDVGALPQVPVSPDFADRVVSAAVAEAQKHDGTAAAVSLSPAAAKRSKRRWMIGAAVASAAALAACFLLVIGPWRNGSTPPGLVGNIEPGPAAKQVAAVSDELLKLLGGAVLGEDEALVLRLRVSKDAPLSTALDAALGKAGIASLASDLATGAASLAPTYRNALEAKYGRTEPGSENKALLDATVAAAQAVFIECPLEQLEKVISELSSGLKKPLELEAQGKLAFAKAMREDGPEGEPGSATRAAKTPTAGQAFAQRLNEGFFRLEKKLADAANAAVNSSPAGSPVNPQQLVRVLILVETE